MIRFVCEILTGTSDNRRGERNGIVRKLVNAILVRNAVLWVLVLDGLCYLALRKRQAVRQ
jgi:hypothetical protein